MGQSTRSTALSNRQIIRAALVVLLGFLASGVLGLVRTAIFSAQFGASAELDAFYTAQQIPELLFTLVAGGALGSSFIPVFSRFIAREDNEAAWRLASATMTLSALAALGFGSLLIVTAPLYIPLLVGQVAPEYQGLTMALTQIMLVTTFIFSISGLLMGILNAHQVFLLPALAMSMNNIGLIIGALVFANALPTDSGWFAYESTTQANIYGLAFGAILGATLHLAVQLPGLRTVKARLRPLPDWRTDGVAEVLRLMLPRVFGLAITRLNFLVSVYFANRMIAGSYTALNTAWFLTFFVLGVIGQSAGTAIFPTLSALAARNDLDGFKSRLSAVVRGVLFLALPASAGLIVLGQPVVALLFERGVWSADDTAATAWALAFFAVGIAGHALLELLSRAFYALSDTRTPVVIGAISLISNIILSVIFIQFIGDPQSLARGPFAGLALANSVTTLLESLALWVLLRRRIGDLNDRAVVRGAALTGLATLAMSGCVVLAVGLLGDPGALIVTGVGATVGMVSFFATAALVGVEEARTVPAMIARRVRRR